ncbi:IS66 family insertion sequence element accessory protein TnpA [Myxococcus llanfairpwllgwyngyllgogerychwyrndrobwllllantysiliogogogochensis]|uniref:IS66 family insertion sequence element accessory protein TnpA n=1 Tax=Myxococcus llanfairpwllgwyngyllgogerychwyrndrobwllllantysiliogogogochensis TaxID=2590453 RepID=UPI001FE57A63|nr:hypothetical protein [Myxococcus llanfairpwllgwyngyllgogerychwyrndrobwllllantysiliogogogochensis]
MLKRAEKPEWVRVAEEVEASGLTQREFAGRRGLRLSTVQSWVYRRRRQVSTKAEPAVRMLPVQVSSSRPTGDVRALQPPLLQRRFTRPGRVARGLAQFVFDAGELLALLSEDSPLEERELGFDAAHALFEGEVFLLESGLGRRMPE